jgi:hypothetical protein
MCWTKGAFHSTRDLSAVLDSNYFGVIEPTEVYRGFFALLMVYPPKRVVILITFRA